MLATSLTFESKILISNLHEFNNFKKNNSLWLSASGKIKEWKRVSLMHSSSLTQTFRVILNINIRKNEKRVSPMHSSMHPYLDIYSLLIHILLVTPKFILAFTWCSYKYLTLSFQYRPSPLDCPNHILNIVWQCEACS